MNVGQLEVIENSFELAENANDIVSQQLLFIQKKLEYSDQQLADFLGCERRTLTNWRNRKCPKAIGRERQLQHIYENLQ